MTDTPEPVSMKDARLLETEILLPKQLARSQRADGGDPDTVADVA
jgi:hypothetical protein